MSRYAAAAWQLLISTCVLAGFAYIVLFIWYPGFFARIDGGWLGLQIVVGVELVLGPLLTLILFKSGKPGMAFDLIVTGLLRVLCISAGAYIVYSERPLFFIYYDAAFYSASADTFLRYNQVPPDPRKHDDRTPAFVVSTVPDNPIEEADFRKILYDDGLPIWAYERSYAPIDDYLPAILEQGIPISELQTREPDALKKWVTRHGGAIEEYAFFPVHSRYLNPLVGIRRQDGALVGVIAQSM